MRKGRLSWGDASLLRQREGGHAEGTPVKDIRVVVHLVLEVQGQPVRTPKLRASRRQDRAGER